MLHTVVLHVPSGVYLFITRMHYVANTRRYCHKTRTINVSLSNSTTCIYCTHTINEIPYNN